MKDKYFNTSVGHLFHSINLKMRKRLDKELRAFGLTSSHQFGILIIVSKLGPVSQKTIASMTLGDEPSTTRLITKLLNRGLIDKKTSKKDKRVQLISLNEKGANILKEIMPKTAQANKEIENMLNPDEYLTLLNILNKINDNLP